MGISEKEQSQLKLIEPLCNEMAVDALIKLLEDNGDSNAMYLKRLKKKILSKKRANILLQYFDIIEKIPRRILEIGASSCEEIAEFIAPLNNGDLEYNNTPMVEARISEQETVENNYDNPPEEQQNKIGENNIQEEPFLENAESLLETNISESETNTIEEKNVEESFLTKITVHSDWKWWRMEDIFSESREVTILKYLNDKNINYTDDLLKYAFSLVENFTNQKSVRKKAGDLFKTKLNQLSNPIKVTDAIEEKFREKISACTGKSLEKIRESYPEVKEISSLFLLPREVIVSFLDAMPIPAFLSIGELLYVYKIKEEIPDNNKNLFFISDIFCAHRIFISECHKRYIYDIRELHPIILGRILKNLKSSDESFKEKILSNYFDVISGKELFKYSFTLPFFLIPYLDSILRKRYAEKITLNKIGEILQVTRENVRQLQKKAEENIKIYITVIEKYIFKEITPPDRVSAVLDKNKFIEFFDNPADWMVLLGVLSDSNSKKSLLTFSKSYNFVITGKTVSEFEEGIKNFEKQLQDISDDNLIHLDVFKSALYDNGSDDFSEEQMLGILKIDGWNKYGDFLKKGTLNKLDLLKIITPFFPEGLHYENDLNQIISRIEEMFPVALLPEKYINIKDIDSRFFHNSLTRGYLNIDSGKYIDKQFIDINEDLFEKVYNYCKDIFRETPNANITGQQLYQKFGSEFKGHIYNNERGILGVLNYLYPGEFNTHVGGIRHKDNNTLLRENFNNLARKACAEEPQSRNKIITLAKECLLLEKYLAESMLTKKSILAIDRNTIDHVDCYFERHEIDVNKQKDMKQVLESSIEESMASFSEKSGERIKDLSNKYLLYNVFKNKIMAHRSLRTLRFTRDLVFSLANYFLSSEEIFHFGRGIVYKKETHSRESIKDVNLLKNFLSDRDTFSREDVLEFINLLKPVMTQEESDVNREIFIYNNQHHFFMLNNNKYIFVEKAIIEEPEKEKLKNSLESSLENSKGILISGPEGFVEKNCTEKISLGKSSIYLNPFILISIINKWFSDDFLVLGPGGSNLNENGKVIVKKNSKINSFSDFIVEYLTYYWDKNQNMIVKDVEKFLVSRKIIPRSLPASFIDNDRVSIDAFDRIIIKKATNNA
jgi:hypothetical protein